MVDWMRILNDRENTAHDDEFFSKLEIVIDYADGMLGLDKNNLSALFFKGGAIGFRGRLRAHRGNVGTSRERRETCFTDRPKGRTSCTG
jgi:hypothetical protein